MTEGLALLLAPYYLESDAKDLYEDNFELGLDNFGGFSAWPEAVQFLLLTYDKHKYLEKALQELDAVKQRDGQEEQSYSKRLPNEARRLGGVLDEGNLRMHFVRGLTADLRPLVEGLQTDPTQGGLYQQVLARASAVGDAHRGMLVRFNQKPTAKTEITTQKPGRHLLAIDHVPPSKKHLPPVFLEVR